MLEDGDTLYMDRQVQPRGALAVPQQKIQRAENRGDFFDSYLIGKKPSENRVINWNGDYINQHADPTTPNWGRRW